MRRPWNSTAGRLVLTFGLILALFAIALLVVLRSMRTMEAAEQEDARLDRAKHAGHRVAALVREQYIHQAHTIIEGNRSHLGHYRDIANTTARAADDLVKLTTSAEDEKSARAIAALVRKNDEEFMRSTLPAIERGQRDEVVTLHADMEHVVVEATRAIAALNRRFEDQSDAARGIATRARSRVRWTAIACFGAALVAAAVFAIATTRTIARRVRGLREGARRFGAGSLERPIEVVGHDELAEVARAMNDMAARLAAEQAELLRAQKLASIGRLCAGVAHELNGPIGIIRGYAKVIRREGADEESLAAIEQEAQHCEKIVQVLLDTSKPDQPQSDAVNLTMLARDAVERLRTVGRLEHRVVQVKADADVVARGDESRLRQVVLNLLTNGVEATGPDGRLDVEVAARDGIATLAIIDDGAGLTSDAQERLFEPFFTTKPEGIGLGLAISRAIVEAHRGQLRVLPSSPRGARAEIRLELANGARGA